MERILVVLLTVCMLLSAAVAEQSELTILQPDAQTVSVMDTEEKLYAMLPILDGLARTMGIEGEYAYTREDADFYWNQLYEVANHFGELEEGAELDGETLYVPADAVREYAYASFSGEMFVDVSENAAARIRYDAEKNRYAVTAYDDELLTYIVVERYAVNAEGDLIARVGLYQNDAENARLGGITVELMDQLDAARAYPMVVVKAAREADTDFEGLTATDCDIRVEEAVEIPASPTPAPTAVATGTYANLAKGDRGEAVRALQNRLNDLGYACGKADGVYGRNTVSAVRYFQDALGVSQNGKADAKLQEKLFASDAPEFVRYRQLKKGSTGIRVEKLQNRLRELGYLAQEVDGDYGDRTKEAVIRFQGQAGLKEDGIAGVKTLKALDRKDAKKCKGYITLRKGDTGWRVEEMQKLLKQMGLLNKVTGKYDNDTVKAVLQFTGMVTVEGDFKDGKLATAELIQAMVQYIDNPQPTVEPTEEPTPTPEPTEEPKPTEEPTPTPDPTATPKPTPEPVVEPTPKPVVEPTDDSGSEPNPGEDNDGSN